MHRPQRSHYRRPRARDPVRDLRETRQRRGEEGGERVGARATYVSDVGQAEQLPDHGELAQEREDDGEEVSVREVGGQLAGLGSGDDVEGGSEEDAPRENRQGERSSGSEGHGYSHGHGHKRGHGRVYGRGRQ